MHRVPEGTGNFFSFHCRVHTLFISQPSSFIFKERPEILSDIPERWFLFLIFFSFLIEQFILKLHHELNNVLSSILVGRIVVFFSSFSASNRVEPCQVEKVEPMWYLLLVEKNFKGTHFRAFDSAEVWVLLFPYWDN